jgi:hypothetical protein
MVIWNIYYAIWYILWLFGKLVAVWYIFPRFGILNKLLLTKPFEKSEANAKMQPFAQPAFVTRFSVIIIYLKGS